MAVRIDHPTLASASPEHASQHYAIQTKIKQQADLGFVQSAATSLPRGDVEQGDVDLIHAAHDYNSAVVVREIPVPKQLQSSTGAPPKSPIFEGSIEDQLKATLGMIDVDECDVDGESAFFVADLAEVYRQHLRWVRELPRIVPFYAVKCNPDPYVLRLLAKLGSGFDCASNGEIQNVLDIGVSPSRIIYANPCKASSFVRQAARQRVSMTTFDNLDELAKMKKFHPTCKLVVRILTDDSKSACQLGLKFGAPLDFVPRLLARARELELDVVGVSFHVGSGCYDPDSFRDAVRRARSAFEMGRQAGYHFDLLDVGGGYDHDNFSAIAAVLRTALDDYFPHANFCAGGSEMRGKTQDLRIIAEPGRYYVSRAFVLAANIIARRDGRDEPAEMHAVALEQDEDVMDQSSTPGSDGSASTVLDPNESDSTAGRTGQKPQVMLYQNDGVYGAFNCIMFDHQIVHPKVLTLQRQFCYRADLEAPGVDYSHIAAAAGVGEKQLDNDDNERTLIPVSVWGPTCDSIDCVRELAHLPRGLGVGDWLVYESMGAYTLCAASSFNGLRRSEVRYTVGAAGDDADAVKDLLGLH